MMPPGKRQSPTTGDDSLGEGSLPAAAASPNAPFPNTPFPSYLIDRIMPELSDTEWRLLCVVVRQTLGWREGAPKGKGGDWLARRKGRDWLTHRQLKARTGRASEAVSRALDGLVRRDLVLVTGLDRRPLPTPAERRRCQGPLFFGLAPRLLRQTAGDGG